MTQLAFSLMRRAAAAVLLACFAASAPSAQAQVLGPRESPPQQSVDAPPTADAVLRAIEVPYLSEDERRARRVFHGLWSPTDLASPRDRAAAALVAGVYDDPALFDPAASPLDRAEAALLRGEPELALGLAGDDPSPRAVRVRGDALESMGRFAEAADAIKPLLVSLRAAPAKTPEDLVEGVRAVALLARVEGRPGSDYQSMIDLLNQAQQEMDRLYWPAILAQAELLYEKSSSAAANKAAIEVLSMNPTCARAWRIIGLIAVDAFNFPAAEAVADRLSNLDRIINPKATSISPEADLLLARAAMRQADATAAVESARRALGRYPAMREALAIEAAGVALQFEFDEAQSLLDALDSLSPGTPLGYYEVGKALSEGRQYDQAAVYLEEAALRQPKWAPVYVELGLLEMQSGRDVNALDALRKAVQLDPFHTRAANSLTLAEQLATYETVESEHFVVRHPPGILGLMAQEMIEPLENIHRIIAGAIEHEPARKTTIELLPDHQTFAVRITGMTGIHTIAASTGPVIAMEAPMEGKRHTGVYDWERVVRHEYVHTVTLSRTNNRIPHWFTEAAAVYLENAPRERDTAQMLVAALTDRGGYSLFDMNQINVAFVRPRPRSNDRAQAYAQGHWMYQFIVDRWGASAPLRMMDLYALGIREEEAMRQVLGVFQGEFMAQFREWARTDAASWGLLPEPSLESLIVQETLANAEARAKALEDLASFAMGVACQTSGLEGRRRYRVGLLEPEGATLDRMLARAPEHPDLLELKVLEALEAANQQPGPEMIPLLERYAAARPVDPMPHRHLARLYLASEDADRAIPHLEYLDAREQKSSAYAVELAQRYAAQGAFERARLKAERATQIAPFEPRNREAAAAVWIQSGDLKNAERHIAALTEIEPDQEVHRQRLRRIREMQSEK